MSFLANVECRQHLQVVAKVTGYWPSSWLRQTIQHLPPDSIELVYEMVLHKNGYVRNNCTLLLIILLYRLQQIIKIGWWMSTICQTTPVSFLSLIYTAWLKRSISRVHVSPGSAETLVRWAGITNHHSVVNSVSNLFAKHYQNWLMWVEVMVCNIQCQYLRHIVEWTDTKINKYNIYILSTNTIVTYSVWTACYCMMKMVGI